MNKSDIKKDTIIYCVWGYNQNNVDFYVVLNKKGNLVSLQKIGKVITYDKGTTFSGKCSPNTTILIDEPFEKKINKFNNLVLNSRGDSYLWDGNPKNWNI